MTLFRIRMPLVTPFATSFGTRRERESVIVRLDAAGGLTGYGECPADAWPRYSAATSETCALVLERHLVPSVLGEDLDDVEALVARLRPVRGHPFARGGLEAAFTDALARERGVSLGEFHGGTRDAVPAGVSVGLDPSPDRTVERVARYVDAGYLRVKLKIRPGHDVAPVEAVRARFPDVPLMVDANAAYRLEDGGEPPAALLALDRLGLTMIEQPFGPTDLVDHAALQRRIDTPVCLDESVIDVATARSALALGSMRVLNIKAPRVGGAFEAKRIHDLCRAQGVPVWCGGLLETGVGRAHNLALASLPGFTLPGDLSASDRYWREDVIEPPVRLGPDGRVAVPTGPGTGVEVVEERLRACALEVRELTAARR